MDNQQFKNIYGNTYEQNIDLPILQSPSQSQELMRVSNAVLRQPKDKKIKKQRTKQQRIKKSSSRNQQKIKIQSSLPFGQIANNKDNNSYNKQWIIQNNQLLTIQNNKQQRYDKCIIKSLNRSIIRSSSGYASIKQKFQFIKVYNKSHKQIIHGMSTTIILLRQLNQAQLNIICKQLNNLYLRSENIADVDNIQKQDKTRQKAQFLSNLKCQNLWDQNLAETIKNYENSGNNRKTAAKNKIGDYLLWESEIKQWKPSLIDNK